MAMAFTFSVLENGPRNYVLHIVGVDTAATTAYTSDGSSNGVVAANGYTPTTSLKVRRIVYNTTNCMARLQWHQTTNAELANLSGYGTVDLRDTQGLINPKGTGSTGDIDLSSIAIAAVASGTVTAAMSITLECVKGAGT
ncbi:MAG: hypothetical protein JWP25_4689 [Bradyrhizobium sp.]|nr:hypothetical protein [Bradyrhizobium sp.]